MSFTSDFMVKFTGNRVTRKSSVSQTTQQVYSYLFFVCVYAFQEGTDDGTAIMIVGNKTDLVEDDSHRAVQSQEGKKLAEVHS